MSVRMKKILSLAMLLVMLLSCSACARIDVSMKISRDGKADFRFLLAVSDALLNMSQEKSDQEERSFGFDEEARAELEAKGFAYEPYKDIMEGYTGCIISREGIDIRSEGSLALSMKEDFEVETGFLSGRIFTVDGDHVVFDSGPFQEKEEESEEAETSGFSFDLSDIKSMGGYMILTLELPVEPTDHNAAVVSEDGKTLQWDLTTMKPGEACHAEFDLPSNTIPVWVWPAAGAALVIMAAVVIALVRKKKGTPSQEPAADLTSE